MQLRLLFIIAALSLTAFSPAQNRNEHSIYVDKQGVMRWSDTDADASLFGTNYTAPFAYAYRALKRKNIDIHQAIDRDVYHMALLGLTAFRLHIWDVEITDSIGNICDNEHIELLDYLIYKVEERGIAVMLTAQTNFGNGYPERNIDTGAYSYRHDKCDIHSNAQAIDAQERYLTQLMQHINRYTNVAYGQDHNIAGFEINNEPCHKGNPEQTLQYIERMYNAMRSAGCIRPIFYNVSHNAEHRQAYYQSPVEGTTYQWYPSGLVSNYTRRGNFLPAFDSYDIPFDTLTNFDTKARIIYEFDPADLQSSYQYPAVVRAFREAGFQWMTQFAYDPTDIAESNTEYQTHYMNLAYTPSKAVSLAIAAIVAQEAERGKKANDYPADTIFGCTTVSYTRDLALYNSKEQYLYTNSHDVAPTSPKSLRRVVGVGSSPIVQYDGTGAYFLEYVDKGVWRLEVMPDAIAVADAYAKPSPERRVVETVWSIRNMSIDLPDIGQNFTVETITDGAESVECQDKSISVRPGVYILRNKKNKADNYTATSDIGNRKFGEFVVPEQHEPTLRVIHSPLKVAPQGNDLNIECTVVGAVDSVTLHPDWVSFWRNDNPYIKFKQTSAFAYQTKIPADWLRQNNFGYYITAYSAGQKLTMPQCEPTDPLDWNSRSTEAYNIALCADNQPTMLIANASNDNEIELYSLPTWEGAWSKIERRMPMECDVLQCHFEPRSGSRNYIVRKFVGDIVTSLKKKVDSAKAIEVFIDGHSGLDSLNVSVVTKLGITYTSCVALTADTKVISIPIDQMRQSPTALIPIAYPDFLPHYFSSPTQLPLSPSDIEFIELSTGEIASSARIDLIGVIMK